MRGLSWVALATLIAGVACGGTGSGTVGCSGCGGGVGGGNPPAGSASVSVGNNFFSSDRNRSTNNAVDTVAVGGKVTWTWANTGAMPHNIQSVGTPSFTSGPVETGNGSTYEMTFTTPGVYRYNCAIHGDLMTGTVVVTPATGGGGGGGY